MWCIIHTEHTDNLEKGKLRSCTESATLAFIPIMVNWYSESSELIELQKFMLNPK